MEAEDDSDTAEAEYGKRAGGRNGGRMGDTERAVKLKVEKSFQSKREEFTDKKNTIRNR